MELLEETQIQACLDGSYHTVSVSLDSKGAWSCVPTESCFCRWAGELAFVKGSFLSYILISERVTSKRGSPTGLDTMAFLF